MTAVFGGLLAHSRYDRGQGLPSDLAIEAQPVAVLKPILDHLWQAAGLERCFDYDEQGQWSPQR
jgi:hypothetical protein